MRKAGAQIRALDLHVAPIFRVIWNSTLAITVTISNGRWRNDDPRILSPGGGTAVNSLTGTVAAAQTLGCTDCHQEITHCRYNYVH
jgi:hypothetical protein